MTIKEAILTSLDELKSIANNAEYPYSIVTLDNKYFAGDKNICF